MRADAAQRQETQIVQSQLDLYDSLPWFASPAGCADNLFKAAVNCLSNPVIQIPHFLDSFTAGRSRTLYGGWASEPNGSTTNGSPLISVSSTPQVSTSI